LQTLIIWEVKLGLVVSTSWTRYAMTMLRVTTQWWCLSTSKQSIDKQQYTWRSHVNKDKQYNWEVTCKLNYQYSVDLCYSCLGQQTSFPVRDTASNPRWDCLGLHQDYINYIRTHVIHTW